MLNGKIQSLQTDKGFGFIRPDDRGPDVFFHRSSVQGTFESLCEGQSVTYEMDGDAARPLRKTVTAGDRPASPGGRPMRDRPPARSGPRDRDPVPGPPLSERKRGFVTKLRYVEPHGFISADSGGSEIRFEPATVTGQKRFKDLQIGDYVEFAVRADTADTRSPEAYYVREIERTHQFPKTQLSRHPRSRGKKPTWR